MSVKNIIILVIVCFLVVAGVSTLMWRFSGSTLNTTEEPVIVENASGEERNVMGEGESVIVEFSDFQCPACAESQGALKEIMERYQGKVRLVYRHFPLESIHKFAKESAIAAETAGEQGKFFEYHDILFERQGEWSILKEVDEKFLEYAEELELDTEKFKEDLRKNEIEERVNKDLLAATKAGLSFTPTYIFNGEVMSLTEIDQQLSQIEQNN